MSETGHKSIIDEKERKRLITEIGRIKEILDSFKYGLNFEEFANELFKTIDRQTLAIKKLDEKMQTIVERMERLEVKLKEGIRVSVSGFGTASEGIPESTVIIEEDEQKEETPEDELARMTREDLEREAGELEIKIAKYFEKENEYSEMVLNDPASAEEYEQKAEAARRMRVEAEKHLKKIKEQLE